MNEKTKASDKTLDNKNIIICKHCKKPIDKINLLGFSILCPQCGKPQESIIKENKNNLYNKNIIICKRCKKPIDKVNLSGFSILCALCGKPQNGEPYIEDK